MPVDSTAMPSSAVLNALHDCTIRCSPKAGPVCQHRQMCSMCMPYCVMQCVFDMSLQVLVVGCLSVAALQADVCDKLDSSECDQSMRQY